ncbi:MAG: hypothetical protein Q8S02_18255 [Hydrogenophaga sp.]|nr:hypothetical protein [Hydrogenophaga sp.]
MTRQPPAHPANAQEVALSDLFVLLEQQLGQTERALLEQNADALPGQSEQLARQIQHFQRSYQESPPQDAATWEPRLAVLKARLDNLHKQWLARSAAVNRALTTLFPAEQANAYARLGQPGRPAVGALPRVSNNTSFKA